VWVDFGGEKGWGLTGLEDTACSAHACSCRRARPCWGRGSGIYGTRAGISAVSALPGLWFCTLRPRLSRRLRSASPFYP